MLAILLPVACAGGVTDDDAGHDNGTSTAANGNTVASGSSSGSTGGAQVNATSTTSNVGGGTSVGGTGGGPSSATSASSTSSGGGGSDACGFPLSGVWFEIDYANAFSATNPGWTFSPTSWTSTDWAPQGESYPEVWDVYNNISISNDPIGKLAVVGPSSVLQIMIGLGGMTSYTKATVCVEGRSVSATASVQFDVYNPLNNCGATATMAHDWQVHAAALDLGTCLIAGNDFQAIRVEPWGGSATVGVTRLTVALQGAVY